MTTILWPEGGRPRVPVTLYDSEGKPVGFPLMLLDTGSDQSAVPQAYFKDMGAKLVGEVETRTSLGASRTQKKYQGVMWRGPRILIHVV